MVFMLWRGQPSHARVERTTSVLVCDEADGGHRLQDGILLLLVPRVPRVTDTHGTPTFVETASRTSGRLGGRRRGPQRDIVGDGQGHSLLIGVSETPE